MNSPRYYPIEIAGTTFNVSESSIKELTLQRALARAHRKDMTFCRCSILHPVKLVVRCYGAGTPNMYFDLAKWQETGLDHHPDCVFFGEDSHHESSKDTQPAFQELSPGKWLVHLSTALSIIQRNIDNINAKKDAVAQGKKNTQQRASDISLLLNLWRRANLNIYRGKPRNWFKTTFMLLNTAKNFHVNKKGGLLSEYLLVGGGSTDKLAIEHNKNVIKACTVEHRRLFVIGRLAPFDRDKQRLMLKFKDYGGLPRISVLLEQLDNMISNRTFYKNVLVGNVGNVIVIACIEPSTNGWWKTVNIGSMAVSENFIPVESSFEIEFENYLSSNERVFLKPLVVDESNDDVKRPDYILLDTNPRSFIEVWGMQTPEYLENKAKRIEEYQRNGKLLISWSANPREEFPALPTKSK